MRRFTSLTPPLVIALALAGCGIANPYGRRSSTETATAPVTTSSPVRSRDPAPERGGRIPAAAARTQRALAAGAALPSEQAALDRYASLDSNWTAANVGHVQDELAAISLGQARAQAQQAAASYARDSTLQRSHVTNTGAVVAIAPSRVTAGEWVIVTREQTIGRGEYAGLPPTLHVTYAQLVHVARGWIVDQWQSQT